MFGLIFKWVHYTHFSIQIQLKLRSHGREVFICGGYLFELFNTTSSPLRWKRVKFTHAADNLSRTPQNYRIEHWPSCCHSDHCATRAKAASGDHQRSSWRKNRKLSEDRVDIGHTAVTSAPLAPQSFQQLRAWTYQVFSLNTKYVGISLHVAWRLIPPQGNGQWAGGCSHSWRSGTLYYLSSKDWKLKKGPL